MGNMFLFNISLPIWLWLLVVFCVILSIRLADRLGKFLYHRWKRNMIAKHRRNQRARSKKNV